MFHCTIVSEIWTYSSQIYDKKARPLFLKSILEENPESLIQRFVILQFRNPTKGNWASSCLQDLKELGLNISLQEILELSKHQFLKIIKKAINKKALEYLLNKQGSKGKEIEYKEMKMAEYLLPTEKRITTSWG